ncbi:MAG: succinyl-CoA synthetase alpha subunit [Thermoanaerobacter sp.]|nr:succinyl-CoA synthetase alpha subunit [Thermoanaerobacter sp.]
MSVLVDENTKVVIQGITGKHGSHHTKLMLEYNAKVLAGVTPGKGGSEVYGVPVYDTVKEALEQHPDINASLIMVPPPGVLSAAEEAIENGIPLVVIVTEHVPVHDTLKIKWLAKEYGTIVIGPNTIGIISPGKSKVGIMPGYIYSQGNIGVISRSGTMTHEISSNLTYNGIGQSTCIGIGGDPVNGLTAVEALELFKDDDETKAIVLIGEIGGSNEELVAEYIEKTNYPKQVYAFIGGQLAPQGKRMGHAGAIVQKGKGTAASKMERLKKAGVKVAKTMDELVNMIKIDGYGKAETIQKHIS